MKTKNLKHMRKYSIDISTSGKTLSKLNIGDIVFLTGSLHTFRDSAHVRALDMIKKGISLPFNLKNGAIWHCGPIVKKINNHWQVISAGSTTSMRMEQFESYAMNVLGFKIIVGKGGMGNNTSRSLKRMKGVYLSTIGGCAAILADSIVKVKGVHWEDLGLPEAVWSLEISDFGPLIVGIDSKGNNLFEERTKRIRQKSNWVLENLV